MGSAGNVAFLFERKGVLSIPADATDEDTLMGIVLEAGADDIKQHGDHFEILCDPHAFSHVKAAIEGAGLKPNVAEINQVAKSPRDVEVETGQRIVRLMEALDDHDDVQNVYSDLHVTEAMVAE
jgi:transcriptional/translational regulatory protein YebC/TACO1